MDSRTIARFDAKVDRDGPVPEHCPELGPCWVWTAALDKDGYGKFQVPNPTRPPKQLHVRAHRFAYELDRGAIPSGLLVCHNCDHPPCVRGSHLFAATQSQNIRDSEAKGRRSSADNFPFPRHRGERHPGAKITDVQARDIKTRLAQGDRQCDIADDIGASRYTINAIAKGRTWRHL